MPPLFRGPRRAAARRIVPRLLFPRLAGGPSTSVAAIILRVVLLRPRAALLPRRLLKIDIIGPKFRSAGLLRISVAGIISGIVIVVIVLVSVGIVPLVRRAAALGPPAVRAFVFIVLQERINIVHQVLVGVILLRRTSSCTGILTMSHRLTSHLVRSISSISNIFYRKTPPL